VGTAAIGLSVERSSTMQEYEPVTMRMAGSMLDSNWTVHHWGRDLHCASVV